MARAVLRVYLGAAPGVGKTFAMLDEGWRRKHRGTDVVVGFVETHGRSNTAAQLRDLEVLARASVNYRGQAFEELDVDGLLLRRPELALVDELAHTNVPGSRNHKRWEDVDELLNAGINVITTVNIQHLESLNDVVQQITGVAQRETVPDAVVRAADQIELVDMSPEALRRRMAHGNVYAADKVDTALANYFRVGNLAALRELALLWVADRVDEALQDYRERHGIDAPWQTKERVVVALTGAPGGDALVRRAARMAMRSNGELLGVNVLTADGLSAGGVADLPAQRSLLEELGGRFLQVGGSDVGEALVQVARAENATQIVLGASHRSRFSSLLHGSIVNEVIRLTGQGIDVHVISTDAVDGGTGGSRLAPLTSGLRPTPLSARRQRIGIGLATLGLPLLTLLLAPVRDSLGIQNALLLYLLVVVAVATIGGLWSAALACVLGFGLLNWFFVPPLHTFTIANRRDILTLVSFLVIAGVISVLVDLANRRRIDALRSRTEAEALSRMARVVLREDDPVPELLGDLVGVLALDGAAVLVPTRDGWSTEASAGHRPPVSPVDGDLSLDLSENASLVLRGREVHPGDQAMINAVAVQLGIALERRRLHAEAAVAEALAKTDELRTALLAAVGHDLRTPLASIKTAATSLLAGDVSVDPDVQHELLETISTETDRLNRLVGNLLDMSRIQTGSVLVQLGPVWLEEVVAEAAATVPTDGRVLFDLDESLPAVVADAALLERVVANLVVNALAYSPPDAGVRVQAGRSGGRVELRVVDRGRGIPLADREQVFRPFQRLGDNPEGTGVGLGLAVAEGFMRAMDGELVVEDTPGGGCTMVVTLPVATPAATEASSRVPSVAPVGVRQERL
jgi:two-component system sensor histidine kinase KdpD